MSILQNQDLVKAGLAGITVLSIDKFYFKSTSLKNSLILAGSVSASNYIANVIMKKNILPDLSASFASSAGLYNTKTVETRILEMGLSVGSAYTINTLILKNQKSLTIVEIGLLFLLPSIVAEISSDYLYNRPISYLV